LSESREEAETLFLIYEMIYYSSHGSFLARPSS
jgi:hypothetical protein